MSETNGEVVSISNKDINSHTGAALNVDGVFVIIGSGPVWGKKKGYTIPTVKVRIVKGFHLKDGKRDKKLRKGDLLCVGCSNIIKACTAGELPDDFLYVVKTNDTDFIKEKQFVLTVDDSFNTVIKKYKSDAKPVKEEVKEEVEEDDY